MGRDFRSSLGAGLDSGFGSDLSALGVGFDSGFESGLSGFDVTMVVLQFWLPPPGASPGKAWKIVEQVLKKAHWRPLKSPKVGTFHAACRPCIPDWRLQKVLTFTGADAVQFCSRMAERPCTWGIVSAAPGGCENTLRFSSMRNTAGSRRAIYPAVRQLPRISRMEPIAVSARAILPSCTCKEGTHCGR